MKSLLRTMWRFIQRENIDRLVILIVVMLVISTVVVTLFERDMTLLDGLWWSIVTMTTVGYGDIFPETAGGRVIAVVIMFFGIGLLGAFSASIASFLVERRFRENQGMSAFNVENHVILCGWNHLTQVIINELRRDLKMIETPIVLIGNVDSKPIDDDNLFFIRGDVTDETLERANLLKANTVVILGDPTLDVQARDARVVLSTLTVESINPNVYTIVELVDESNAKHCERANADEIIVNSDISSGLIARATLDHGLTKVISQLLSNQRGTSELYKIAIPARMVGQAFMTIFTEIKQNFNGTVIGVQKATSETVISNPAADYILEADDKLIVIATGRPQLRA